MGLKCTLKYKVFTLWSKFQVLLRWFVNYFFSCFALGCFFLSLTKNLQPALSLTLLFFWSQCNFSSYFIVLNYLKGYIWPYIPSWVPIRTVYHNIRTVPHYFHLQLVCMLPRECTVKYTPHLKVILKSLIQIFKQTKKFPP